MDKKKEEEEKLDVDYLWKKYGIHSLCKGCKKKCKQYGNVDIYTCPNHISKK